MSRHENWVYRFSKATTDGNGSMRDLLGGKGAGLAEMTRLSICVPPGFTITTEACRYWLEHGRYPEGLRAEIASALQWLEEVAGRRFNDHANPLLVSVRSGAPISMPGMMDTILNVGLNDSCVEGLAANSGSCQFAFDSHRRLIEMFGTVVLDLPRQAFDQERFAVHRKFGVAVGAELPLDGARELIQALKGVVQSRTGRPFPEDPQDQLTMAIEAVFQSWLGERAQCYRKLNGISETLGTAVTVQAMVFGNRGSDSGTGVGFSRNPSTGERAVFGEFLPNAQGEDIVAGTRTPMPIAELANSMPEIYRELLTTAQRIESHCGAVQDFEFTIEQGKLFLLQTRNAKLAAAAEVRSAVEMCEEGRISKSEALMRVRIECIGEILSPQLDLTQGAPIELTRGLAASPGAAVGQIALSADEAVAMAGSGKTVILVTEETTADDIHGMAVAQGFLTARGGATSHAAVVARGMGVCCITGAKEVLTNEQERTVCIGGTALRAGDWLSLEGSTGRVFAGKLAVRPASQNNEHLAKLLDWAIDAAACSVRANADTPADALTARAAGATGIGLCRTEHMFFAPDRLDHVRSMILADTPEDRANRLAVLLPMQQSDFEELFRAMSPLPVTIRLLDPPLHEFLPSRETLASEIADARREEDWERAIELEGLSRRAAALAEVNPMMGHRGCRLSLTFPEILEMQVRAILQAALAVAAEGPAPSPEIMVPLVASEEEMKVLAALIRETAAKVFTEKQSSVDYKIGTMIELPRAAICAGRIAHHVSFVSFGTNDLTQMTYGFSRDDSRRYLDDYLQQGIFKADPFVSIDREGVGYLIRLALGQVRAQNPGIKTGVCGEHGGDPESIQFFHSLGVDYVSCSPARLPLAQLAAAHAEILQSRDGAEIPSVAERTLDRNSGNLDSMPPGLCETIARIETVNMAGLISESAAP
jgi:pyruvate,orthophosphate dikinase